MAKFNVKYEFAPLKGVKISRDKKSELNDLIADYVKESVLADVGAGRSPVTGQPFKKLSKEYAQKEHGGDRTSHLELFGDMLDSLEVAVRGNKLTLTVGKDQMAKADGHNNFSGQSKIPTRPFIPNGEDGESFRPQIEQGIESIIELFLDDEGEEG